MPSPTQFRGGRAEQRAVFYLMRNGYTIMGQHITSRFGEIDIIAEKDSCIYLVEVKSRKPNTHWPIELSMTQEKINRMILTFQSHQKDLHPTIHCLWLLIEGQTIREIHQG